MFHWLIAILIAVASSAHTEEKVENYPDGAKHLVYSVESDGTKSGAFKELAPDGKPLVLANYKNDLLDGQYHSYYASGKVKLATSYRKGELDGKNVEFSETGTMLRSASYRAGKLNGPNLEYSKGQAAKAEFWIAGKLIVPKSAEQIAAEIAQINRTPVKWVGEFPKVNAEIEASLKDSGVNAGREAALRALMSYRMICGLPFDLEMDRDQTAHAQAGAQVMRRTDKMSHFPENTIGMPDDEFQFARTGTSSSNIHMQSPSGETLLTAMRDWMGDSDASNVAKLGHRRWCLNPAMGTTGFGIDGNYTDMWSFDSSRKNVPDYDYVAFPPRGLAPMESFHEKDAWNVSLNPAKYARADEKSVKIAVWQAKFSFKQAMIDKASMPMQLENVNVSLEGMGVPNCIIFRPVGISIKPDSAYWVEISGLKTAAGDEAKIEYLVDFFSLAQTRSTRR